MFLVCVRMVFSDTVSSRAMSGPLRSVRSNRSTSSSRLLSGSTRPRCPGTLGTVTMANGAKQITYNGYPLYLFKGAGPFSTKGQGLEGKWHVIKLKASDVTFSG